MNPDIVSEILRFLHLAPEENKGALLAKRILISTKKFKCLQEIDKKLDKPIVFSIVYNRNFCGAFRGYRVDLTLDLHSIIYLGDGTSEKITSNLENFLLKYEQNGYYVIKIFNHKNTLILPSPTIDVYSIGLMENLSYLFSDFTELDHNIGKNWNTENVTNMFNMFYNCTNLNQNIGKNWNTENVKDMSFMFYNCRNLNKNIGKNWNTENVNNMSFMFCNCKKLNQNIGKNWNTENVYCMIDIFVSCPHMIKSELINRRRGK